MSDNKLALLLSVSNLRPVEGSAVNFGLTARNRNDAVGVFSQYINLIDEIEIKVELSDGLEFNSGWQPTLADDKFEIEPDSRQSGTWMPEGVDTVEPDPNDSYDFLISRSINIQTQLTADSLTDIPLEERCITAWVEDSIPPPSPDYVFGRLTQCLGDDDPTVVFERGELRLFYLHPCVGVTPIAYPCRDENSDSVVDDGLELVVRASEVAQPILRRSGIARSDGGSGSGSYIFLRPENVVVQIDPAARVGTKWYTGSDEDSDSNDAGIIPGVLVHLDFLGADWKPYSFAISDVNPKKRPGSLALPRMDNTGFTILDADTITSLGPVNSNLDVIPLVAVFGTLGTYVVDITMGGTSGTAYTSTGRYTFHVGPIAELEARDAGQNPALPAGQRAYTIMAVNNGPDTAPAAKMTLTDLDADSCAGDATKGMIAFVDGECAWTIGELLTKDISQASRGRDGEVLTIIISDDVDAEITATISNTQDYQVCIDSSGEDVDATSDSCSSPNTWHTAKYYDYISDNSTDVTIQAKEGTGADLPSVQTPQAETAAIIVSWEPVTEVNGRTVTHYQVQRETNPWVTVADNVPAGTTKYVDTDVTAGVTYRYQVRAVNDQDQAGPWSVPIEGTATMMEPEVVTRTETVFRDRVVTETETITVGENPFAYFADEETTRTVAENSAPGSPVGAPVTVIRNSGNKVVYSLEGPDAALFTIEEDTGQILVGEGALLDFESGTTSYTVEVVADPRSGADVRNTVTITVTDVAETGFVFIDPAGAPLVGAPLFAGLLHTEGEPVQPRWQWQRSMPDGTWADIPGAIQESYTPTDLDAGRRLRALVVFGNPQGDGEGLAGAVTERVPGEAQVIPTAGTGAPPEEVFGVLGHSLAAAWRYHNATQTWAVYSPWNDPELNDLKTVSRNDVVWMDMIGEAQFQGNTLYPGWNQVIVN